MQMRICNGGDFKSNVRFEKIDHSPGMPTSLNRIVSDVAADPGAIGYGGFSNKKPHTRNIALSVTAKGPYLIGTFEEVAAARFPLTRFVYVLVNKAPGKPIDRNVVEFLKYVLSREGQQAVEAEGVFLPLPASLVRQELEKLK